MVNFEIGDVVKVENSNDNFYKNIGKIIECLPQSILPYKVKFSVEKNGLTAEWYSTPELVHVTNKDIEVLQSWLSK